MKKFVFALLIAVLATGTALAGDLPSAKGSAAITGATIIEKTDMTHSWDPVLSTKIQVAQQKELIFDVALQCGLFTDTLVRSKGGTRDESSAEAGIDVRVKLEKINNDGTLGEAFLAYPNSVTYAKRTQDLMAKFQGIFQTCEEYGLVPDLVNGGFRSECIDYGENTCLDVTAVDNEGDGVIDDYVVTLDEACLDYEEVRLALDTLNANAFNFVSPNLEQGDYQVTVEAEISSATSVENGDAAAKGMVGMGSMVVDEVRFIKADAGTGM